MYAYPISVYVCDCILQSLFCSFVFIWNFISISFGISQPTTTTTTATDAAPTAAAAATTIKKQ